MSKCEKRIMVVVMVLVLAEQLMHPPETFARYEFSAGRPTVILAFDEESGLEFWASDRLFPTR